MPTPYYPYIFCQRLNHMIIKDVFKHCTWVDFCGLLQGTFFMARFTYLYLRRHSPGIGWSGITNRVDHVADGGTPGSVVLCELTRDFHSVLSALSVAEDSQSRGKLQVCLNWVVHVFSWPPVRLHLVRGGVGRSRPLISSPSGRLATWPNQWGLLCTSCASILVRQRRWKALYPLNDRFHSMTKI